jgi:hypothetical protein
MTRNASVWLVGSALAVLVLAPLLGSPPVPRPVVSSRQVMAAPAAAIAPTTNIADDDDESRQQRGPRAIPVAAVRERADVPALAPPRLVLARHELALDPLPIGVRKLPSPSADAPPSH